MVNKRKKDREFDSIVNNLLDLPITNLESRIHELEDEITFRSILRDNTLSQIGTNELQLKDQIQRLRYTFDVTKRISLHFELTKLRLRKAEEQLEYFRDISRLRERLIEAKEELRIEIEKRRLVHD